MSAASAESLYGLLPQWIRLRDQEVGNGALQALLGVIASQAQVVDDNLDQLYDDFFIETCAQWVIPYIGDLIGFRPLRPIGAGQPAATRAEVANTIGYRRRKGTVAMLEQLGFDVIGWPTVAVEFFSRLATTQYVRNHVRPGNAIVDVRSWSTANSIGSAFDRVVRSADVRRISSGRSRYNIQNVGLFVWRLKAYGGASLQQSTVVSAALARSTALRVGADRYTFDPFGGDVPLVNPPRQHEPFTSTDQQSVPFWLRRFPLYAEPDQLFADPAVFTIYDVGGTAIDPANVEICDLSAWTLPTKANIRVSVDPELGRLVFAAPAPAANDKVSVSYAYAFGGDYGGGTYARTADPAEADPTLVVADFAAADLSTAHNQVVEIADSGIHPGDVSLAPDSHLLVVRAADDARPVVDGNLSISAVAGGSVTLRGIGIRGDCLLTRDPGAAVGPLTLRLEHCTLRGTLRWPLDGGGQLVIDHSLCGPLEVHDAVEIEVHDSVIDAGSDSNAAISAGAGAQSGTVTIGRSTVFGRLLLRELPLLENSIMTGVTTCARTQLGCVRYSYLPRSSVVPRRFRTQPDTRIDADVTDALRRNPALTKAEADTIAAAIEEWLRPSFTSRVAGQPGYAQLADSGPDEIRFGAEEDGEMGVFFGLFGPRREENLRYRVAEYLRIGLEAGILHAS